MVHHGLPDSPRLRYRRRGQARWSCWTACTDRSTPCLITASDTGCCGTSTPRPRAAWEPYPHPDVFFSYLGTIPELPVVDGPVQLDMDAAMPAREMLPGLGHALELRVYRTAGLLHLDWWFDIRRLQPSEVKMLAEHFPVSLTELTQEAIASADPDDEMMADYEEFALVDLSSLDDA